MSPVTVARTACLQSFPSSPDLLRDGAGTAGRTGASPDSGSRPMFDWDSHSPLLHPRDGFGHPWDPRTSRQGDKGPTDGQGRPADGEFSRGASPDGRRRPSICTRSWRSAMKGRTRSHSFPSRTWWSYLCLQRTPEERRISSCLLLSCSPVLSSPSRRRALLPASRRCRFAWRKAKR